LGPAPPRSECVEAPCFGAPRPVGALFSRRVVTAGALVSRRVPGAGAFALRVVPDAASRARLTLSPTTRPACPPGRLTTRLRTGAGATSVSSSTSSG